MSKWINGDEGARQRKRSFLSMEDRLSRQARKRDSKIDRSERWMTGTCYKRDRKRENDRMRERERE